MPEPIKVYLAGPDVFYPDAIERGERLKALCEELGMVGLFPLDNQVPHTLSGSEAAAWIAQQNMTMIHEADAVIANLQHFRGAEPDSGTVFECGVAVTLGKPLLCYAAKPHQSLRDQVPTDDQGLCRDGLFVEDFGLPRNLMLATLWDGFYSNAHTALEAAHKLLGCSPAPAPMPSLR